MQRFINNPDEVVEDTVKGFVKAHSDIVRLADNPRVIVAKDAPVAGKVGVVTGGGSGHEPAFIGYTGRNMLDAVAVGELFSSPTAKSFHDAIRAANGGKGVVVLYGNYAGDNMNVKMANKLAAKDGIEIATVVANDDVCSAPPEEREKRRGVAGEIFMWKIGGAKASQGASLEELYILNDTIESEITARGLRIHKTWIGNYFTSLEMVGATLTVMALDDELKALLDVEARCTIML